MGVSPLGHWFPNDLDHGPLIVTLWAGASNKIRAVLILRWSFFIFIGEEAFNIVKAWEENGALDMDIEFKLKPYLIR